MNALAGLVLVGSIAAWLAIPSKTTCTAGPRVIVFSGGHTYRGQSACAVVRKDVTAEFPHPATARPGDFRLVRETSHQADLRIEVLSLGMVLSLLLFALGQRLLPARRRRPWLAAVIRGSTTVAAGAVVALSVVWIAYGHAACQLLTRRNFRGSVAEEVRTVSGTFPCGTISPVLALSVITGAVAVAAFIVEVVAFLVPAPKEGRERIRRWRARAPRPVRPARLY